MGGYIPARCMRLSSLSFQVHRSCSNGGLVRVPGSLGHVVADMLVRNVAAVCRQGIGGTTEISWLVWLSLPLNRGMISVSLSRISRRTSEARAASMSARLS